MNKGKKNPNAGRKPFTDRSLIVVPVHTTATEKDIQTFGGMPELSSELKKYIKDRAVKIRNKATTAK